MLTAIALLILASLTVVAGGSAARTPEAGNATGLIQPQWTPLGLRNEKTTVIVQMKGDPVALRQAAAGRDLSSLEKSTIKAALAAQQNAIKPGIASLGGAVLADYQAAYNGIKVSINRRQAASLGQLANVVAVRQVHVMERNNVHGVQLIGAPGVWDAAGGNFHGEGIKIAIIDTGVDYTHANFGGPGTTVAYNTADAADTLPANATLFGPAAPRVKGGTDLVGDDYDASADPGDPALIPHPDPNPLDCNGHGSHVAGTAAGSGVLADGKTYTGPYQADTITSHSWTIAPGVAPKADIYAIRVFGCEGSTDVTVDAIEWAVNNEMDVINMSLGSPFGGKDDPSAVASTNAAKAGVVVVASAGNEGPSQYITGSPATADGAISVAASDPVPTFEGVSIKAGTLEIDGVNANLYPFTGPFNGNLKVIKDNPATGEDESLGCSVAAYGALPADAIAVVNRGTCARAAKPIFGQQAGAKAVIMVNNAPGFPPIEGKITSNPDDGTPFTVTIPFIGVKGPFTDPASDGAKLRAVPDGTPTTLTPKILDNPGYLAFASFSSSGPRTVDSFLKPDITAPGVSTVSTGNGTGNGPATISGTSMASPHVAGVAALTVQAHPTWTVAGHTDVADVAAIKAAIVNTGDPAKVADYRTSRGGTGLVQPQGSTKTTVVARTSSGDFDTAVNFGFAELGADFNATKAVTVYNKGASSATFGIASAAGSTSRAHTLPGLPSSITVPANSSASFNVTLNVPAATAGRSNASGLSFREVVGLITLTPTAGATVALRVPYYLVPRALSKVTTQLGNTSPSRIRGSNLNTTATVSNPGGMVAGDADFYAWGLEDAADLPNSSADVRAIGAQAFDAGGGDQLLVFAVNTHRRWSNAAMNEHDIFVDVDANGSDDYVVVGADQGAVTTGTFNGRMGAFVFSTRSPGASLEFLAADPTDSSTVLLPVLASQLCRDGEPCLRANRPRIKYSDVSFDVVNGGFDEVAGIATFDAYNNTVGEGSFVDSLAPNATTTVPITISVPSFFITRPKGLMVVTMDNASGAPEAQLIPIAIR